MERSSQTKLFMFNTDDARDHRVYQSLSSIPGSEHGDQEEANLGVASAHYINTNPFVEDAPRTHPEAPKEVTSADSPPPPAPLHSAPLPPPASPPPSPTLPLPPRLLLWIQLTRLRMGLRTGSPMNLLYITYPTIDPSLLRVLLLLCQM